MSDQDVSHRQCVEAGHHVCQRPSGRACVEQGCSEPAGTRWGPLWCPQHDQERLDRITASLENISAMLKGDA